jgi:phage-related minor tail protein
VQANRPYVVGEVGPELFVPSQSGAIVPNHAMGGQTTVVINYTPTFSTASTQEIEAFVPVVERSLRQIQGFS